MNKALKPCPFCGGNAEVEDHRTIFAVSCGDCTATVTGNRAPEPMSEKHSFSIDWEHYEQTAIDKWNQRVNHE